MCDKNFILWISESFLENVVHENVFANSMERKSGWQGKTCHTPCSSWVFTSFSMWMY